MRWLILFAALATPVPARPSHGGFLVIQDGAAETSYAYDHTPPPRHAQPLHQQELSRPNPRFPSKPGHRAAGFIALGDSYSAGIGTGINGTEDDCRHGLHAHPVLLSKDLGSLLADEESQSSFQFLSCTGSTIQDVLLDSDESQIGSLNASLDADFALLSVGGNDLGFFEIMNSCIFRFYSFYSGTCDEALAQADEALASPDFDEHLRLVIIEILDSVQWEKRPWFTITVTGYARFFNDETPECDDSSFGIWWRGPKLKRALRRRMNDMVRAVNSKIRRSVDAVNAEFTSPKVRFVDYDDAFEGHRFCEPGVVEPDYQRNETWFFLVRGPDNADDDVPAGSDWYMNDAGTVLDPDSVLVKPEECLVPAQESNNWGIRALCMMATASQRDPSLNLAERYDDVSEQSMWYVPTYYGQTFHPVRASPKNALQPLVGRY